MITCNLQGNRPRHSFVFFPSPAHQLMWQQYNPVVDVDGHFRLPQEGVEKDIAVPYLKQKRQLTKNNIYSAFPQSYGKSVVQWLGRWTWNSRFWVQILFPSHLDLSHGSPVFESSCYVSTVEPPLTGTSRKVTPPISGHQTAAPCPGNFS